MHRGTMKTIFRGMLLWFFVGIAQASVCGPGVQWIASCNASTETLQITMNFGLDTDFNSLADVDVSFTGAMQVVRGDPYASDPVGAPGNIDRIDTEIVSMVLTGATPFVSGWQFRMGVDQGIAPSPGFIQQQTDSSIGLSRFDTVFEIDSAPYGVLTHDLNPSVFFEDLISGLPEIGAKYNHTGAPFGTTIPLFDANGIEVLRLTDLIVTDFVTVGRPHFVVDAVVVPIPAAAWLMSSGLIGLAGIARRRKRRR